MISHGKRPREYRAVPAEIQKYTSLRKKFSTHFVSEPAASQSRIRPKARSVYPPLWMARCFSTCSGLQSTWTQSGGERVSVVLLRFLVSLSRCDGGGRAARGARRENRTVSKEFRHGGAAQPFSAMVAIRRITRASAGNSGTSAREALCYRSRRDVVESTGLCVIQGYGMTGRHHSPHQSEPSIRRARAPWQVLQAMEVAVVMRMARNSLCEEENVATALPAEWEDIVGRLNPMEVRTGDVAERTRLRPLVFPRPPEKTSSYTPVA